MVDQLDSTTRSPNPDAEIDDPLAELARIIGYERPAEVRRTDEDAPESNEFDLEAELMRELDVPLAPSVDDLDRIEADEALDELLADGEFDHEPDEAAADADELQADLPELDDAAIEPDVERSSGDLLNAIESEFPVGEDAERAGDEPVVDEDDLALAWDADELASDDSDAKPDAEIETQSAEPEQTPEKPAVTADVSAPADDAEDDVLADMVRFELPRHDQAAPEPAAKAVAVSQDADVVDQPKQAPEAEDNAQSEAASEQASLDFEEYLSTELDVFGQEVAMGTDQAQDEATDQTYPDELDEGLSVESALDALNDSTLDEESAVFDDAAEELLAGMQDDTGNPPKAEEPEASADGDWSLESIEEAASDEIDDELGDIFDLPERVVDPAVSRTDNGDDLEFDLEQVLADSFGDDDWAEPLDLAETKSGNDQIVEPAGREPEAQVAKKTAHRDEMAEAFLGLVSGEADRASTAKAVDGAPVSELRDVDRADGPEQSDWLAGFETSERTESAGSTDEFYFDADLISDADETVEAVAEIDVPELVHDDPQPVEPDYDTEIEREFADIIERHESSSEEEAADVAAAGFGAAEGWSREARTPRGYEVSDEYIALERELGSGVDRQAAEAFSEPAAAGGGLGRDTGRQDRMAHRPAGSDNSSRGPVLAVAVLGLAVLAGLGAFGWSMWSGGDTGTDGEPRIIRADKEPVKVLPENPGGVTVPNQDKAVYDRVAGGGGPSAGQPALVNSAEEPIDVVQRTLDPEILPLEGRADTAVKSEERLAATEDAPADAGNGALAPMVSPRKVRTMVVKPDGSIVAREEVEPETPATAAAGQADPAASTDNAASTELAATSDAAAQPAAEPEAPAGTEVAAADATQSEGTVAPVRVVKTQPIRPVANAPVPQGRPADQPVNVVGTVTQGGNVAAAPAAPAAPAQPVAPAQPTEVASAPVAAAPVANPGGYYVQIASQPTEEGAQSSWRTLSNRYSSVLGGFSVDIQRADIPGKGVFHRVRVPAGTKDQANALCSRYKAAGGSCFVSR